MTKIQAGKSTTLLSRWHAVKVILNIFPSFSLQRGTTGGNEEHTKLQEYGREAFLGDKVNLYLYLHFVFIYLPQDYQLQRNASQKNNVGRNGEEA